MEKEFLDFVTSGVDVQPLLSPDTYVRVLVILYMSLIIYGLFGFLYFKVIPFLFKVLSKIENHNRRKRNLRAILNEVKDLRSPGGKNIEFKSCVTSNLANLDRQKRKNKDFLERLLEDQVVTPRRKREP